MLYLLRPLFLPVALLAAFLLTGCARHAEVCFQPHPGAGRVFTIHDRSEMRTGPIDPAPEGGPSATGMPVPSGMWFQVDWELETVAGRRNLDGSTPLTVTYSKARSAEGPLGDAPTGSMPVVSGGIGLYNSLEGGTFTVTMTPDGTLAGVQGHGDLLAKSSEANPDKDPVRDRMASLFSDEGAAKIWADMLVLSVPNALTRGESWTRDMPVIEAPSTHRCTYTVRHLSHRTAWLDLAFDTKMYAGDRLVGNGAGTGKMVVDLNTGWIRKVSIHACIVNEFPGMPVKGTVDSRRTIMSRPR
jgi:hypothetical protein